MLGFWEIEMIEAFQVTFFFEIIKASDLFNLVGCLMLKLLLSSWAVVCCGWAYIYFIRSDYIPRTAEAFEMGLPVNREMLCKENNEHD